MYGLLGKKLSHSFSPIIHKRLGNKEYKLIEKTEIEAIEFIKSKQFKGINVTIPYKEIAKKLCDELSEEVIKIGVVNTIKNVDGKLYGYNTDYFGMKKTIENLRLNLYDKKVLILGNGATTKTTKAVLDDLGINNIVTVSRTTKYSFTDYNYFNDSNIIINCTPVGMFPYNMESLIDISKFKKLECVIDLIYNPINSKLILDSMDSGIKTINGLTMLVSQAIKSSEIFFEKEYSSDIYKNILNEINFNENNIVLIGMPGSGKTTIGKLLSEKIKKTFVDTDWLIEKKEENKISNIFEKEGEEYFRNIEKNIIFEIGKGHNQIISTGGGAVLDKSNYYALKQNALIIYLKRDINDLEIGNRPIAKTLEDLTNIYEFRKPLYEKYADYIVENINKKETVEEIYKLYINGILF